MRDLRDCVIFEAVCKECGDIDIKEWIPGIKMADIKDPCPRCGGTDWADRRDIEGSKISSMLYGR
jgi:hypothetical protein